MLTALVTRGSKARQRALRLGAAVVIPAMLLFGSGSSAAARAPVASHTNPNRVARAVPAPHKATPQLHTGPLAHYTHAIPRHPSAVTNIAHTFHVNTTNDTHASGAAVTGHFCDDGTGACSLRAAIEVSNGDPGKVYRVFVPAGQITLLAANGELDITNSILVIGVGAQTKLDATGCGCRIFDIDDASSPNVSISSLTMRNGAPGSDGGAIWIGNAGVSLDSVVMRANTAAGSGGAIYLSDVAAKLWLSNSQLAANTASSDGGAIFYNYGQSVISNTWIGGTTDADGNGAAYGGGIYNDDANLAIYDSHVDHNSVSGDNPSGGGIYNCCFTIVMQGGTISHNTVTGNTYGEGGGIYNETPASFTGVAIKSNVINAPYGYGGGVYNDDELTLDSVNVDQNVINASGEGSSSYGGGIYNDDTLHTTAGSISGNTIQAVNPALASVRTSGTPVQMNGINGYGGGIYNDSMINLHDTDIVGNEIHGLSPSAPPGGSYTCEGGGIYDDSVTHLHGILVKDNVLDCYYAYGAGAALYGHNGESGTTAHSYSLMTFIGNAAWAYDYAEGGAIDAEYGLGLHQSSFKGNKAISTQADGGGVEGGAIYENDSLTLDNVTFADTTATSQATSGNGYVYYGAVYCGAECAFNHVDITGTKSTSTGTGGYVDYGVGYMSDQSSVSSVNISNTTNHADASVYAGTLYFNSDAALRKLSVKNTSNTVSGVGGYVQGGAIYFDSDTSATKLAVSNTTNTLTGANAYVKGGALYMNSSASLNQANIVHTNNQVGAAGVSNSMIQGGAIYANISHGIFDRTTVGYTTARAFGDTSSVWGAGIWFYSDDTDSFLHIVNSTLANNTAVADGTDGGNGGALYGFGPVTFSNVTMDHNKANDWGSSVYMDGYVATFHNTIVERGRLSNECYGTGSNEFVSAGFNLTDDSSCNLASTGDRHVSDPKLGPLASHGGYTWTEPVLTGSRALNNAAAAGCPTIDQRGIHRPQGPACDIGAYEKKV